MRARQKIVYVAGALAVAGMVYCGLIETDKTLRLTDLVGNHARCLIHDIKAGALESESSKCEQVELNREDEREDIININNVYEI